MSANRPPRVVAPFPEWGANLTRALVAKTRQLVAMTRQRDGYRAAYHASVSKHAHDQIEHGRVRAAYHALLVEFRAIPRSAA